MTGLAVVPVAAVSASSAEPSRDLSTLTSRQIRAGLGVSVTNADSGFASTFQAGVQVNPWPLFGFRGSIGMTSSVVGAGGWDAAEATGSALFLPFGDQRRVVPYVGLGVQFALLAIFPDPVAPPPGGLAKLSAGHLGYSFNAAPGEGADKSQNSFGGTNQFKVIPEASAGALIKLTQRIGLDVSGRYLPLSWNGTTYNGLSVVASICAPF
jgi:hypothetical protein